MNHEIKEILEGVQQGTLSVDDAMLQIKTQPFDNLGYAKVDLHRKARQGNTEVIYGASKTAEQMIGIIDSLLRNGEKTIIITRLQKEAAEKIMQVRPLKYYEIASFGVIGDFKTPDGLGKIVVATGGTSDIPVAEEAALTAEALGNHITRLYDVGVSGIHRLLAHNEEIMTASVIIAIAGMEGALASVIGGLADCPVIAVPTSVGYGTALDRKSVV